MPKATPDDLLIFISERGEVRAKDLEQEFVKTRRMSRGTMYKYKRLLEDGGKIQSIPVHDRPPYYVYYVPQERRHEVDLLKQYRLLSKSLFINAKDVEWIDPPKGYYLTDVKQKVLWEDEDTGATMALLKYPLGISGPVHFHPDANQWVLGISGESEQTDGTRVPLEGSFSFVPKGENHGAGKFTKDSVLFVYWDGPRTNVQISN